MRLEKVWIEQCRATRVVKRRFGVKDALDYLVGEKLRVFAEAARHDTAFAQELPRFLAAIWRVFNVAAVGPGGSVLGAHRDNRWDSHHESAPPVTRVAAAGHPARDGVGGESHE